MGVGSFSFISSPDDRMEYLAKYISVIQAEGQLSFVFTHSHRQEGAV